MKKSNEEFLQQLDKKNPKIEPLEDYKGGKTNILCRCRRCQHEWYVRPSNLLSGKDCPICAIRAQTVRQTKSTDTFIKEMSEKNPEVEVLGKYEKSHIKILCRCRRCKYEWKARPDQLLQKHGCPVCGKSMRREHDEFIMQLKKINPMIEPLETYTNARTKILCRCNHCKSEWKATPYHLLQGTGCSNCDKKNKTSFPEQAIYFYLQRVYPDVINRYIIQDSKMELDIFIPSINVGVEYDGIYWHKSKEERDKQKYQKCMELGIGLYRVRESAKTITGIADNIIFRDKPYDFKTLDKAIIKLFESMGVEVSVNTENDSARIREQYYTEFVNNSLEVLYPVVAAEWHTEKNGKITPKMVSYGSNDLYWWKCNVCQNEWRTAVVDRTVGGSTCPECNKKKNSERFKMKHEDFVERLKCVNPNLEPLEEYKTTHEKILIRCKCGNVWPAAPANLLRGRDCPKCSKKRAAAKLSKIKCEYYKQKRVQQNKSSNE